MHALPKRVADDAEPLPGRARQSVVPGAQGAARRFTRLTSAATARGGRRPRGPNLSGHGRLVVKLGSSIVADDRGERRRTSSRGSASELPSSAEPGADPWS